MQAQSRKRPFPLNQRGRLKRNQVIIGIEPLTLKLSIVEYHIVDNLVYGGFLSIENERHPFPER
jgi:hypothetical protein